MTDYTFDPVTKDPAESRVVELELFNKSANFWRPNEQYQANEYIRPNTATGFAYQTTTGGTSGLREPRWPTVNGATIGDGSVIWTATAAGANGLNPVSSPSAVSSPTGLTIGSVAVSETTKILATYSSGIIGQDYDAIFTFTLNGVTRIARQTVRIRYR
jgi:hypothetical protein